MYLQARLNLHACLYSRAQASSRNLVSARVQRTCCQNTRECVWVGGDEGRGGGERVHPSTLRRDKSQPTCVRYMNRLVHLIRRLDEHALADFLAASAPIHTKRGPSAPFQQLHTLRQLRATVRSPALATTRVTARSSNSSRSVNGRSRETSYLPMSFWMRSMASTVASASPKAVRRT